MAGVAETVFVVEDDASVREALEGLILSAGWQVRAFASAHEFLDRHQPGTPGCLVLDVELPGLNGLELQERLAATGAAMPIVFITGHGDIPMSVRAMKAGAIEFLTKPFLDRDVLEGIRAALERDRAGRGHAAELDELRRRYATLTPREREVMSYVVAGRLNKQTASAMGTSLITVKVHRGRVMAKMQAKSLADLVRMAGKLGGRTT